MENLLLYKCAPLPFPFEVQAYMKTTKEIRTRGKDRKEDLELKLLKR